MSYDIVPYTPEFNAQIADLHRHLGNSDVVGNAAYLKWKYAENPFFDEALIYLALHKGRVVGLRGMFGTLWQVDDEGSRHLLPYADDLVVDPEHRNRGVVRLIMKAAMDDLARRGYPFVISLSAGPVTYVISLALGWRLAGSFEPIRRGGGLLQPGQQRSRVRAFAASIGWLRNLVWMVRAQRARTLFQSLDRTGSADRGDISLSRSPRAEAMADLVARLPWDGRLRHVRDARYFDWRFRNPRHEYRFLFAGGERLKGYLVLQRYTSDSGDLDRVNIVDWEAADDEVRAELLATALRWGRFGRVQTWMASTSDSTRAMLRSHAFVVDPDRIRLRHQGLLIRRISDGPDANAWRLGSRDLLNIHDWDVRMLYSMIG